MLRWTAFSLLALVSYLVLSCTRNIIHGTHKPIIFFQIHLFLLLTYAHNFVKTKALALEALNGNKPFNQFSLIFTIQFATHFNCV